MRERDVERYLREQIERIDGQCLKFVSPGRNGVPDRLVLLDGGIHFFVEVKRPNERPTRMQMKCHRQLQAIGHDVYVVANKEEVDALIRQIEGGDAIHD